MRVNPSPLEICIPSSVVVLYGRENVRNVLNSNPALIFAHLGLDQRVKRIPGGAEEEKPACSHRPHQDGLQFKSLERLGTRMCVTMVIIYKKTLGKKGGDDVTSTRTDLGTVRGGFLTA